jgi:hypothetical protein
MSAPSNAKSKNVIENTSAIDRANPAAPASTTDEEKGVSSDAHDEQPGIPKIRKELRLLARWNEKIDATSSGDKILEILASGSHVLQDHQSQRVFLTQEGEAVLLFEELHRLNIRQHQLRLLEISRGFSQQNRDDLHKTLHQYRE